MELEGKGNAKTLEVKLALTNPGRDPYPDPETKPGSDPIYKPLTVQPVKKKNQKQRTRVDHEAKYKKCMKNHAALTGGGHVVDGCCEFMPSGEQEGTLASLKCAACNCHRSFHRKEVYGHRNRTQEIKPRGMYPTATGKIMMSHRNKNVDVKESMIMVMRKKKKRVRTKISEEQKEKMKEFARESRV